MMGHLAKMAETGDKLHGGPEKGIESRKSAEVYAKGAEADPRKGLKVVRGEASLSAQKASRRTPERE